MQFGILEALLITMMTSTLPAQTMNYKMVSRVEPLGY